MLNILLKKFNFLILFKKQFSFQLKRPTQFVFLIKKTHLLIRLVHSLFVELVIGNGTVSQIHREHDVHIQNCVGCNFSFL